MGKVYMIGKVDTPNVFKIGVTRNDDVSKRLKQLQTSSDEELYVYYTFETSKPFKLETMLHNHYSDRKQLNEWFKFTDEDMKEYKDVFNELQGRIDALKDNPFFA